MLGASAKGIRSVLSKVKEQRRIDRRRVLKAGSIVFGGSAIDCVVRNMSETGAALEVTSPVGIPVTFTLVHSVNREHKHCTILWRKENRIGVTFS